jgi:hypothetical protein
VIELYVDTQPALWMDDPSAMAYSVPFDLDAHEERQ